MHAKGKHSCIQRENTKDAYHSVHARCLSVDQNEEHLDKAAQVEKEATTERQGSRRCCTFVNQATVDLAMIKAIRTMAPSSGTDSLVSRPSIHHRSCPTLSPEPAAKSTPPKSNGPTLV
jgi:hypothetical protein